MTYTISEVIADNWQRLIALIMDDQQKSKDQLIQELNLLRDRVKFLESIASGESYSEQPENSNHHFETFVKALPGRAVVFNADGYYTRVIKHNHAYGAFQPETTVGKSIYNVQPKAFADFCMNTIREVLENKSLQTIEYGFTNAIGEYAYHEGHITPWYESDSHEIQVLWVSRDITAQKNAEEAHRKSEERLHTFIDILPDRAVILNQEGRYLHVIKRRQDIGSFQTSNTVIGKTLHDIQSKEFADFCMVTIQKAIDLQEMQLIEYDFVNQVGKHVYYEGRVAPLITDDETQEPRVMWISRDITSQKSIEEALRKSEERLRTFIDLLPDRAVILNKDGIYVDVIKQHNVTETYQIGNTIGQKLYDVLTKDFADFCMTVIQQTLETKESRTLEYDFINIKGEHVHYEGHIAPWNDSVSGETHVLWIARDITKQKEAELENILYRDHLEALVEERTVELQREIAERKHLEALKVRHERLAAIGQLAAGIAHDFNNVMGVIIFDSSMVLRTANLTEREQQKMLRIQKQADHASSMIKQILDFSRRSEREPHILDLRIVLGEIVKFLVHTISERIQVEFNYSNEDFPVNLDPTQIQQIITNLAINAQDAIVGNGELKIYLSCIKLTTPEEVATREMPAGDWVRLQISDTGSGITAENLEHIFEPFFTTKEVGKGTGLGLAQVYGIVQQHEGYITVDSESGAGTTFTIYFPHAHYNSMEIDRTELYQPEEGLGEMILVVEDNEDLRESLTELLETLNYEVLQARNGEEAIAVYEANMQNITLIMSDVMMPGMDGAELIRRLQVYSPIPKILMMSGFRQDANITPEIENSVIGWLQKPIDINMLAETVQNAIAED